VAPAQTRALQPKCHLRYGLRERVVGGWVDRWTEVLTFIEGGDGLEKVAFPLFVLSDYDRDAVFDLGGAAVDYRR